MEVKCDKCGAGTFPKEITSKKTGKNYTVYECEGGCMNGKFRYSRFAPSDNYGSTYTPTSAAPAANANLSGQLKSIDAKLNQILKLLQAKQGSGGGFDDMPPSELEPDNEIPF